MNRYRVLADHVPQTRRAAIRLLVAGTLLFQLLERAEAQVQLPAEIQRKVLAKLGFAEPVEKPFNRLFTSSRSQNVFAAVIEGDDGSSLWQGRFFLPNGYLVKPQKTQTEQGRFNWLEYGQLLQGGIQDLQPTSKLKPYASAAPSGAVQVRVAKRALDSVDYVNRWQLNNLDTWSFTFTYHLDPELPELPKLGPFKGKGTAQINPATGEFDAVTKDDVGERFGSSLSDQGAQEYSRWLAERPNPTADAPVTATFTQVPPTEVGVASYPGGLTTPDALFAGFRKAIIDAGYTIDSEKPDVTLLGSRVLRANKAGGYVHFMWSIDIATGSDGVIEVKMGRGNSSREPQRDIPALFRYVCQQLKVDLRQVNLSLGSKSAPLDSWK